MKLHITQIKFVVRKEIMVIANDKVTIANVADGFYGANSTSAGISIRIEWSTYSCCTCHMDSYVIEITSANVTGGISGLSAGKLVVQMF